MEHPPLDGLADNQDGWGVGFSRLIYSFPVCGQVLQVDAQMPITSAGHGDPDGCNPLHEATAAPCPPAFSLPAPTPATASMTNNPGHAESLLGKNSFSNPFATKPGECSKSTELSALS